MKGVQRLTASAIRLVDELLVARQLPHRVTFEQLHDPLPSSCGPEPVHRRAAPERPGPAQRGDHGAALRRHLQHRRGADPPSLPGADRDRRRAEDRCLPHTGRRVAHDHVSVLHESEEVLEPHGRQPHEVGTSQPVELGADLLAARVVVRVDHHEVASVVQHGVHDGRRVLAVQLGLRGHRVPHEHPVALEGDAVARAHFGGRGQAGRGEDVHLGAADHHDPLVLLTHLQQTLAGRLVRNEVDVRELGDRVADGSSMVPDTSPPSMCTTRMLFSEPTRAPASASTRSPWTTITSGRSACTNRDTAATVLASTCYIGSPSIWFGSR